MEKREFFRNARSESVGPLAGTRVIEIATTWAGPMCACMLGDLGAEVIKVELPEGEVARRLPPFLPGTDPPLSFVHATVNRNKRGMRLDLRTAEGRDVLLRLAARADVLVENFRPGTLVGWGLGYEQVRAVKPDIVYVSISGFGQFGPDHERPGYDPMAQAASGFMSLNGDPDGAPVKAATLLADDLGGLHGAIAALAALCHRRDTGEGQHVDVSLLDAMLFQSNGYATLGALGVPYPRMGNEYVFAAPARAFACVDGHVYMGVLLDSHWKELARLVGRPDAPHPAPRGGERDHRRMVCRTPRRRRNEARFLRGPAGVARAHLRGRRPRPPRTRARHAPAHRAGRRHLGADYGARCQVLAHAHARSPRRPRDGPARRRDPGRAGAFGQRHRGLARVGSGRGLEAGLRPATPATRGPDCYAALPADRWRPALDAPPRFPDAPRHRI
jgi:formyl-CoA transferase